MPYRLAALDLDGTLLNSQGRVSEGNAEALRRLAKRGVVVAPATARWYQAAVRPFRQLGLDVAAIASGGADVRGGDGGAIARHRLPEAFARFVAELCERAAWPATLAVPERAYQLSGELPAWAANAPEWLVPVTHLRGANLSGLLSVLLELEPGDRFVHELEAWRGQLAMHGALSYTGASLLTITARGVDKGSGLRELCAALGIDPAEAVAFGDSEVDIPMFEAAGLSVAMGNATAAAVEAADWTTLSADEDGVAAAIGGIEWV